MTSRKTFEGPYFKALDDDLGTFEAVVSVFGNVDYQGDRVMPGAFEDHLKSLRAKGAKLPVVWSHDWGNPFAHIGYVDPQDALELTPETAKAKGFGEILGGLYVKGQLDIHKEFARQVYDLLKDGRVREWSFAYDVVDEERAKDHANNLNKLAVWEVGPTLKGANNMTTTIAVKSALDTAHRVDLGAEMIREAFDFAPEVGMKMLSDWVEETKLHVDGIKWDGPGAMRKCKTAGDFRSIAFELKNDSDPDTQAHWALPHHASPHGPADDGGVSAALGRLNQTGETVMSKESIRSHLERHQGGKSYDEGDEAEDETTQQIADTYKSDPSLIEESPNAGNGNAVGLVPSPTGAALVSHLHFEHDVTPGDDATEEDLEILHRRSHQTMRGTHMHIHEDMAKEEVAAVWEFDSETKAFFKPWHIEQRDSKYCVIKDSDGSTAGCHDTRDEAVAQMRALYANEPKTAVVTVNTNTTTGTGQQITLERRDDLGDKAGRRISKDSEQAIRDAIANLQSLLESPPDEDEPKNTEPESQKDEGAAERAHYKALLDSLRMDETN